MPTDIRLEVGILDHPKKVKLVKKLGWEAFECLLRLWMYVRERRPKGILTGMSPEDLEIAAKWEGESGVFYKTLVAFGWLDLDGETIIIHDWAHHQHWAFGAEERSRISKENVNKRWEMERERREKEKPEKPTKGNSVCSFDGCKNPSIMEILGRKTCAIPKHRNTMMTGLVK